VVGRGSIPAPAPGVAGLTLEVAVPGMAVRILPTAWQNRG
jgi:hypothetical protein